MSGVQLELEMDGFLAALRKTQTAAVEAATRALSQLAEETMTESKANYCPVDTGALRASGHVKPPEVGGGNISVELGYGGAAAPYALYVHEGTVHMKGRKYLETPLLSAQNKVPERVAGGVSRVIQSIWG